MNLYLDLGATHIKVLYNDKVQVFEYLTKEKVCVKDFSNFVKNILNSFEYSKLYVCSQMHGFHIRGTPHYISWMCEDVEPTSSEDLKDTGLFVYHGLPYFNSKMYENGQICTLVDTLLDEMYHISHETLECGTGFYDMKRRCQNDSKFTLPMVVREGPVPCGKIGESEVYAPLGDLQSAVMGIDQDLKLGDVIINMGTGSQVIQIGRTYREDVENRPLFGYILNCLTHIPSGRSMKFFKDLFDLPEYSTLEFDDVVGSKENINLGYFKSAHGFDGYGAVNNINENTTKYTIACSLMRCYIQQYVKILDEKFRDRSRIFLTGGIAKNIPIVKRLFEYYLNESVSVEDNDTLKGLYKYSKYDDTCFWFNR
jgi:hypothetical protein